MGLLDSGRVQDVGASAAELRRANQVLDRVADMTDKTNALMRSLLQYNVQTLDSIIYEKQTIAIDTLESATVNLLPQTRQNELITSVMGSVVNINGTAITVATSLLQLGAEYYNAAALLANGTFPGNYGLILSSDSNRKLTVTSATPFPAGSFLTLVLGGIAIPATLGEVLT